MSRRKQDKLDVENASYMERKIRLSMGHSNNEYHKKKYKAMRRLKCDVCKKTWKFSDKLNLLLCPACKKGRLR